MRRILSPALLIALTAGSVSAQLPQSPISLGTAGAGFASERGHLALYANPAHLGLDDQPYWSVGNLLPVFKSTMVGPLYRDLPDLANFDDITLERAAEILRQIPSGTGMEANYETTVPLAGLQVKRLALGVSYHSKGEQVIGKDIVDLVLNGYQEGRYDYSVGTTTSRRVGYWDGAVGYGRKVGPVSVGVTGHYYWGGTVVQGRLFEPVFYPTQRDLELNFVSALSRGVKGWGVDVGVAAQPIEGLTLSAAVKNAAGSTAWNESLTSRNLAIRRADIEGRENPLNLVLMYEASEVALAESSKPDLAARVAEGLTDGVAVPRVLETGAAYKVPFSATRLSTSYRKVLGDGSMGRGWEQRASVGVEQKVLFVTARGGYATDLDGRSLLTGGLSLGPMQLGFGRIQDGVVPSGVPRSGYVASFGLTIGNRYTLGDFAAAQRGEWVP